MWLLTARSGRTEGACCAHSHILGVRGSRLAAADLDDTLADYGFVHNLAHHGLFDHPGFEGAVDLIRYVEPDSRFVDAGI